MLGYDTNTLVSYNPVITDLNGDGRPDIWFGYFDYNTGRANQVFLNNGNETFTKVASDLVNGFSANGGMIPVSINNRWALLYAKMNTQLNVTTVYLTKPVYSF